MKIHCKKSTSNCNNSISREKSSSMRSKCFSARLLPFPIISVSARTHQAIFLVKSQQSYSLLNESFFYFNILGTYECQCNEGFKSMGNNQCGDIDECLFENGGCDHQCNNFVGSFQCSCRSGYHPSPDNLKMCVDIDECSSSSNNNSQNSLNSLKCSDKVEKI